MKRVGNHFVVVIEDLTVGKIVSSATLLVEHKFIHSASQVSKLIFSLSVSRHSVYICSVGESRMSLWMKDIVASS